VSALREESVRAFAGVVRPVERVGVMEWAAQQVDYARNPLYRAKPRERYNPDFMPGWREPAEAILDKSVREVWILKCSRAGCSENVLLNQLQYTVARAPRSVLYMTGQQTSAETFMETRIKRRMTLSPETQALYARARATEHKILFEHMDLHVSWQGNRMAYKQEGYDLVLLDEVSMFHDFAVDVIRERTADSAFSTIVGISSPDAKQSRPSRDDPIFIAFREGDQRYLFMPDPKTRRPFRFEMGDKNPETPGLKWDPSARREDGSWDLERVRESAHYRTPDGTIIRERHRMVHARKARWMPTNPSAPPWIRSYHENRFYNPYTSFGDLAVAFLKAKGKGKAAMKAFVYEYLAEEFHDVVESAGEQELAARQREYERGQHPFSESEVLKPFYVGKTMRTLVGTDVQKAHFWTLAVEYVAGSGDFGLVDYASLGTWEELDDFCRRARAYQNWIDYGYERRQAEVLRNCHERGAGWIPAKGFDRLLLPYQTTVLDAYEGRRGARTTTGVLTYSWRNASFKALALASLRGEPMAPPFHLWRFPEYELVNQITGEECVDGAWVVRRGHQNHLWDCLVLTVLAAVVNGIYPAGMVVPAAAAAP